jgi:predicted DNA-binding protein
VACGAFRDEGVAPAGVSEHVSARKARALSSDLLQWRQIPRTKTYYNFCHSFCKFIFNHKEITMHAATLSFRAGDEFAEQTRALASMLGLKSSDYIRQAVREKNEQVMAQRMAMLSKALSSDHLGANESLEDSLEDGLH